jgi:hypothetical protein
MSTYLIALMKALEERFPPQPFQHHALTFARYGSVEDGFEDKLALQIGVNGRFYCLFLDDRDFSLSVPALVAEIARQLVILPDSQTSDTALRYTPSGWDGPKA